MEVLLGAVAAVMVDQSSKGLIISKFAEGQFSASLFLVRFRRVTNPRPTLGLIRNRLALLVLWSLAVLCTVIAIRLGQLFANPVAQFGLGLALGGATGNFWDIWRRNGIVDFIDLGFWPVFNLADAAIVAGTALALYLAWR